jgi:hypothetical protein
MLTEKEIKAETRLWALECLVCQLGASALSAFPPEFSEGVFKALLSTATKNVFPGLDPAESDHLSAEFETSMTRLVTMMREYKTEGEKKSAS